jgi:hypothetical protein
VIGEARKIVRMPGGSSPLKIAAISLLGREENKFKSDRDLLGELLIFSESSEMKFAVIEALARMGGPDIPRLMIVLGVDFFLEKGQKSWTPFSSEKSGR